jgi:hypothetical protein
MNPTTEVVSAPVILPFAHALTVHRYTDVHAPLKTGQHGLSFRQTVHLDECREEYSEEYSEELSETYVHPPLSQYPNLLDSTDLNTLYQTNHVEHNVPLITKEDDTCFLCNLCQIMDLLHLCTCCR